MSNKKKVVKRKDKQKIRMEIDRCPPPRKRQRPGLAAHTVRVVGRRGAADVVTDGAMAITWHSGSVRGPPIDDEPCELAQEDDPFARLSDEVIVLHVWRPWLARHPHAMASMAGVCRRFRRLARSPCLWSELLAGTGVGMRVPLGPEARRFVVVDCGLSVFRVTFHGHANISMLGGIDPTTWCRPLALGGGSVAAKRASVGPSGHYAVVVRTAPVRGLSRGLRMRAMLGRLTTFANAGFNVGVLVRVFLACCASLSVPVHFDDDPAEIPVGPSPEKRVRRSVQSIASRMLVV